MKIGRINEVVRFQPCLDNHSNQVGLCSDLFMNYYTTGMTDRIKFHAHYFALIIICVFGIYKEKKITIYIIHSQCNFPLYYNFVVCITPRLDYYLIFLVFLIF